MYGQRRLSLIKNPIILSKCEAGNSINYNASIVRIHQWQKIFAFIFKLVHEYVVDNIFALKPSFINACIVLENHL